MKRYQSFLSENFQFLEVKFSIYLNRRVFVMHTYLSYEEKCVLLYSPFCISKWTHQYALVIQKFLQK